jgi:hypothetical protein
MKKANEYIKNWSFYDKIPTKELEAIIKLAQEDAIRETVKECVKESEVQTYLKKNRRWVKMTGEFEFDSTNFEMKNSVNKKKILSVADKLIKEL